LAQIELVNLNKSFGAVNDGRIAEAFDDVL